MTVVDQTTDRPIPVVPRSRRLARALAKPGWVIMTLLSLVTIAFVARYLAFNPDTYFPEQREVYMRREWVLGVHVRLRHTRPGDRAVPVCGEESGAGSCGCIGLSVRSYIASCTGLGLSGLVLATTSYPSWVTSLGFGLLGLSMLFTTWTALRMVIARSVQLIIAAG